MKQQSISVKRTKEVGKKLKKKTGVGEGKRERKRKRGAWKVKSTGLGV